MIASTKLTAAVIGGLLLAVYTPAWAGSANDTTTSGSANDATTTAASSSAPAADRSLIGVLSPLLEDAAPHEAQKRCKSDSLYSQHDTVGDSDACFLNSVNVPII